MDDEGKGDDHHPRQAKTGRTAPLSSLCVIRSRAAGLHHTLCAKHEKRSDLTQ